MVASQRLASQNPFSGKMVAYWIFFLCGLLCHPLQKALSLSSAPLSNFRGTVTKIRPHRRCWGMIFRMALVKGYRFTWGGGIFRPKPPVFDRSWRSPSKNTVKNSMEDTCSWTRPSKIGKRKVKKNVFFNFLTSIFWFATSFFAVPQVAGPGGGFLSFWTRFRTDFRRFVIAETLVFTAFFCFLHAWRLASKLPKTS